MNEAGRELPEDLESMAPGPELAALLASVDRRQLSEQDRVRLVQARNRLVSHQQAHLLADMYAVSCDDTPEHSLENASRYPWAEAEVAFALRWTRFAAGRRLEQARQLIEDLPAVQASLVAGDIDLPKAYVIGELAGWLDDVPTARKIVDKVIGKAPGWTTGQLRARLRALVLAVDPHAARKRCAAAVRGRRVESFDNPDGSGELWGRDLPPQDAAAAWERLTAIARSAKAAGDDRSIDQLRADALLDLVVGEGIAVGAPLGEHTAGVPDTDHLADDAGIEPASATPQPQPATPARPATPQPQPAAPARPATPATPAAPVPPPPAIPDGWDPAWPVEPWEPIGPHDVFPDPTGPPADAWDEAGRAYDGAELWPPDWPGRWVGDPAVAAAAHPVTGLTSTSDTGAGRGGGAAPVLPVPPRRGVVDLQVPLVTLLQLADLPGELGGWGPVVADIARHIAERQSDGTWRFSVYGRLGELAYHGITRQRPTAETAAFVSARDHTCVAPGCRRPAAGCDLDHTVPKSQGGGSGLSNLGALCRLHHRLKHSAGAELIQTSPGCFGWTTPRGMQYVTTPHRPLLAS